MKESSSSAEPDIPETVQPNPTPFGWTGTVTNSHDSHRYRVNTIKIPQFGGPLWEIDVLAGRWPFERRVWIAKETSPERALTATRRAMAMAANNPPASWLMSNDQIKALERNFPRKQTDLQEVIQEMKTRGYELHAEAPGRHDRWFWVQGTRVIVGPFGTKEDGYQWGLAALEGRPPTEAETRMRADPRGQLLLRTDPQGRPLQPAHQQITQWQYEVLQMAKVSGWSIAHDASWERHYLMPPDFVKGNQARDSYETVDEMCHAWSRATETIRRAKEFGYSLGVRPDGLYHWNGPDAESVPETHESLDAAIAAWAVHGHPRSTG